MRAKIFVLLCVLASVLEVQSACTDNDPPTCCSEQDANQCSELAGCDYAIIEQRDGGGGCFCPEGLIGNGCVGTSCGGPQNGCSTDGWAVRVTFELNGDGYAMADRYPFGSNYKLKPSVLTQDLRTNWTRMFDIPASDFWTISSMWHEISVQNGKQYLSISVLVAESQDEYAGSVATVFNARRDNAAMYNRFIAPYVEGTVSWGANVYRWAYQTTSAPQQIQATGMEVDFVQFDSTCALSGCWVIDITYTTGDATGNFNTFFIPRVQDGESENLSWQEEYSYDRDFENEHSTIWDTFFPARFPCGSNIIKDWGFGNPSLYTSTCCLVKFFFHYRPIEAFKTYFQNEDICQRDTDPVVIERPGYTNPDDTIVPAIDFPTPGGLLVGKFDGMEDANGVRTAWAEYLSPMDPYIGQHKARIYLDEVELRRKAGRLRGTVGVEYTIDTFIGYANFRPTGGIILDSAAMQVPVHLEKTNFFSVSTEGTNSYTFLEYVNMRLVTVYKQDVDWREKVDEFGNRFARASSADSADYVQVTFTMGEDYSPNLLGAPYDGGLIPLNSVRAGKGTFFDDAIMQHKCVNYKQDAANFWTSDFIKHASNSGRRSGGGDRGESPPRRNSAEKTWGPLDTCSEQSRCLFAEFTQHNESLLCGTDCEWEVCIEFANNVFDGCRVAIGEEKEDCDISDPTTERSWKMEFCNSDNCDCPADLPTRNEEPYIRETNGFFLICTGIVSQCSKGGPGDILESSHFENLYMWCDQTAHDCPADQDFPDPAVDYFVKTPRENISFGDRMCQRGKPGQKLFFVMRDGEVCQTPGLSDPMVYEVTETQKVLWKDNHHVEFPDDAWMRCEPRNDNNDQCPGNQVECPGPDDTGDLEWPCGCTGNVYDEDGGATEAGFDSCSTGIDLIRTECVWTVQLPDNCDKFCTCGYNAEKDQCEPCFDNEECPQDGSEASRCCPPFNSALCQSCAPSAQMCESPWTTPDHFVSFNIPLGSDWYPAPSETLDQNVFVHMVINALDSSGCSTPNSGCEPLQVKTTLSGSIPVVEGGLNIFCDGVRAKTDLQDVANADIVVGTAGLEEELTRLRILENIASTSLQRFTENTNIDSDSIEAGFLTFVVKGNASYFGQTGTTAYGVELEDLITIHIMEPATTAFDAVNTLLAQPPADNYDNLTNILATEGYDLNGAFRFEIDRVENRAYLEPTNGLLALCPFNPPRPTLDTPFPTTCVTRRDVRFRGFPNRPGEYSTAMEVVPLDDDGECETDGAAPGNCDTGCTLDQNARFMATVLGDSTYADGLGRTYSCLIAKKYELDGRFRRAWWINPSYEWTPTQTGGQPIFTISQKIFLFALINLNELFGAPSVPTGRGSVQAQPSLPARRRRVLLSSTEQQGAGLAGSVVEMKTDPRAMIASAFDVPTDRVATWEVQLALSAQDACLAPADLQRAIRARLTEMLEVTGTTSLFHNVLVSKMEVDHDGVECPARRRNLLSSPTATVEMMVVFAPGGQSVLNEAMLLQNQDVVALTPREVSDKVTVTSDLSETPAPWARDDDSESSGPNMVLIAGCAAGGGVLLIGAGAMLWYFNRRPTAEAEVASALPDLAALKSQLSQEAHV